MWSALAGFLLCSLATLGLSLTNLVKFGNKDAAAFASAQTSLQDKDRKIQDLLAQQQDFTNRFAVASASIRNIKLSLFDACRRALEKGDRANVDQQMFTLDQLAQLVPDDESEAARRKELQDAVAASPTAAPTDAPR